MHVYIRMCIHLSFVCTCISVAYALMILMMLSGGFWVQGFEQSWAQRHPLTCNRQPRIHSNFVSRRTLSSNILYPLICSNMVTPIVFSNRISLTFSFFYKKNNNPPIYLHLFLFLTFFNKNIHICFLFGADVSKEIY